MTDNDEVTTSSARDAAGFTFQWPPELVATIDEALRHFGEIYEVSRRLKAALPDELEDHVKAFIRALDYHQRRPSAGRETVDDLYGPMFTTEDYSYPEPLSSVIPETASAWRDAVRLFSSNDVVSARLNDLLWCVKARPRPDRYARSAQAALRRLWSRDELASVHRADAMTRALELAVELRDSLLVDETVPELVAAIRETLADEEWMPGVAVPMIEALAGLQASAQPPDLDGLLEAARVRYSEDPFIVEALQLLGMQRETDADERRLIALGTVDMWRRHAEASGGLVGVAHLERALELARNEALTDAARSLRVQLQQPRTPDQLGMERIASDVSIPSDAVEGFIATFVETSGAEESLARLGAHTPITDVDADADLVKEQMQQFPLQHTFSTVVTNGEGVPLAHVTSDEQKFSYALVQHHTLSITLWGSFLGEILKRLGSRGKLTVEDVREHVKGHFVDDATAEGVARAYAHFQVGDYEASLHYLLVRIERVIRRVAREIEIPIYREPSLDGRSLGAYKGLGELLALLEGRIPEHHRRYISVLLAERTGLNLRNRSAHGLMETVSADEAALAFHVMTVLSRWSRNPPEQSAEAASQ